MWQTASSLANSPKFPSHEQEVPFSCSQMADTVDINTKNLYKMKLGFIAIL